MPGSASGSASLCQDQTQTDEQRQPGRERENAQEVAIVDERERETVFLVRRTLDAAGLAAILTILTILSLFLLPIPTRQTSVLVGQRRERRKEKARQG